MRTPRLLPRFIVSTALLLAWAATLQAPSVTAGGEDARHCVAAIDPGEDQPVCYASFAEAIAAATDGGVRLDRDARPGDLTDRMLERAAAGPGERDASVARHAGHVPTVVTIAYADRYFGGDSLALTTKNPNGCRFGSSFTKASLSSYWNDQMESIKAYQGCTHVDLFKHSNFRGQRAIAVESSRTFGGGMANEVSSLSIYCFACNA